MQDLHFAAAADAGSKAYSVCPQFPWQAEGTVSRDAKEGGDVGTDDGVAFSGTVGSRLDSQMTRGVCNTRRLDEITVSCHHSISKSISFSGFVKTSNNSLSPFPKS